MPCYEMFMELRKCVLGKLAIFLKLLLAFNTNQVYINSTPIKVYFTGTVFGDKGYISKRLKELLNDKSINLVTRVRKNMTPQELPQELDKK